MGNIKSTPCGLSREKIYDFVKLTTFTSSEIRALWHHFMSISKNGESIDRSQFQVGLLFRDSALLDRMFRVFDKNDDAVINFEEYITCLSTISSKATNEDKQRLSFQIYDFDCDGFISVSDMTAVVAATLREHEVIISRADLDKIVEATMTEANPTEPGKLSFDDYCKLVTQKPHMLAHLTLNISSIIVQYTNATDVGFATPRAP